MGDAAPMAMKQLPRIVHRQAVVMGYGDAFFLLTLFYFSLTGRMPCLSQMGRSLSLNGLAAWAFAPEQADTHAARKSSRTPPCKIKCLDIALERHGGGTSK